MTKPGGLGGATLAAREGGVQLGATQAMTARRGLSYQRTRDSVSVTPEYVRSLGLNDRDHAILLHLGEVSYATAEQLAALFFHQLTRPVKKARERLKQLWEMHLLDRVPGEPLVKYGWSRQLVYTVGRAGRLMLAELHPKQQLPPQRRGGLLLAHNVLLGQALVNLHDRFCRSASREMLFYGERMAQASFQWDGRHVALRPDGLLVWRNLERNVETSFFLELDTGTQGLDSFITKSVAYNLYARHDDVRLRYAQFPIVLVIVWAPSRLPGAAGEADRQRLADRRLANIIDVVRSRHGDAPVAWAFTRLDAIATDPWWLLKRNGQVARRSLFDTTVAAA